MANVTLITGAAGALGTVVASELIAKGHRIAAVDLPRAAERLAKLPGVLPLPFETNQADAWGEALARAERELGPLTGAVLIAGGWQGGGPLHARTDDAIWQAMLAANLESAYRALRAVLPGMVARKAGSVVMVGSRAAVRPDSSAGAAEYAATKSAVVALAQATAAEVLDQGVRVNAVLPSTLDTAANRKAMPGADPSRWVAPASLAGVVDFLLSDLARDISGAAIPVYGKS
jgi:NAD(P)-dependent dehydrogenase (short-subunit alcohol dehydrogenase family)